ncbi:MAG: methyltransferase domain-containing protein [Candidatus Sungbacteria bacterium]|nr:methyltransferase domain-containing protein [bacterium]MDZ4260328.1 methyltransferase domain-containing protein [Candidatus Sungbacteria bacterium]
MKFLKRQSGQNIKNIKSFYNKNYTAEKFPYGLKPNSIIKKLLKYVSSGRILDLGAGYGKDSLFLASKGFEVFAIDISSVAIAQLKSLAKKSKFKINAKVGNLDNCSWPKNIKIFIDIYALHHFPYAQGRRYLKRIQDSTPKGGFNVIKAMMKKGDLYEKNKRTKRLSCMFDKGELKRLYKFWEILEYKESKNPDKKKMENFVTEIIARKKFASKE